jgi:hypothetical protein
VHFNSTTKHENVWIRRSLKEFYRIISCRVRLLIVLANKSKIEARRSVLPSFYLFSFKNTKIVLSGCKMSLELLRRFDKMHDFAISIYNECRSWLWNR